MKELVMELHYEINDKGTCWRYKLGWMGTKHTGTSCWMRYTLGGRADKRIRLDGNKTHVNELLNDVNDQRRHRHGQVWG